MCSGYRRSGPPPDSKDLRHAFLVLQDPLTHQPARRVVGFRSEADELPQIQQVKRDPLIGGRLSENAHALNLEHVPEKRSSGQDGSTGHYAFVGLIIKQFDQTGFRSGQRRDLLGGQQGRVPVSEILRLRIRDLIREVGLLESQDVYVRLHFGLKRAHLRCAPEADEVHAAFPALARPVLISHPVSRRGQMGADMGRVDEADFVGRGLVEDESHVPRPVLPAVAGRDLPAVRPVERKPADRAPVERCQRELPPFVDRPEIGSILATADCRDNRIASRIIGEMRQVARTTNRLRSHRITSFRQKAGYPPTPFPAPIADCHRVGSKGTRQALAERRPYGVTGEPTAALRSHDPER